MHTAVGNIPKTKKGRKKNLSLYRSRTGQRPIRHRVPKPTLHNSPAASNDPTGKTNISSSSFEYVEIDSDSDECKEYKRAKVSINNSNTSDCDSDEYEAVTDSQTREQYTDVCQKILTSENLWAEIIPKMYESKTLKDFMLLIEGLRNGSIPMDNIVFLLMLERARFGSLENTCSMRYRDVTKLFWLVVYRLCKSSGLKFFSGAKNWGQVVSKESEKSFYRGSKAKINFAVPDEKMLRDLRNELPKVIPPGIINKSIGLLKNQRDVILMADGKLLSRGLGDNFRGDVNLFGHESNPNIAQLQMDLMNHLNFISNSLDINDSVSSNDRYSNICEFISALSKLIQRIRNYMNEKMDKLKSCDESSNVYSKYISKLKTEIFTASLWIKKSIKCNAHMLHMLSCINTNNNLFELDSPIQLNTYGNIRMLHNSHYISQHINAVDHPHVFKLGSDISYDIEQQSLIPAHDAYKLMGLDSMKALRTAFKTHITQEIPYHQEQITDYQPRIDAIATTSTLFMPAYLPSCALLYEEGVRTMDGTNYRHLFCCRTTASIRHHHGTSVNQLQCQPSLEFDHENLCLVINTDAAIDGNKILTQLPCHSDIVNCLITMSICKKIKCLYVCVGNATVSFSMVTFNDEVWHEIESHLRKYYDCPRPSMPMRIRDFKRKFHDILQIFVERNCSQICEMNRIRGQEVNVTPPPYFCAYMKPSFIDKRNSSVLLEDDFEFLCYELSAIIEEGFNHLRVEASEIIAFVATNPDRLQIEGIPPHLPIAYGLRGASMTMEVVRNMLKDIHKSLDENNVGILCEVYDGQFHKLITKSIDGTPLTRLQFQQQFFKDTLSKFDRKTLLESIKPYSKINEDDLIQLAETNFDDGTIEMDSIVVEMKRVRQKRCVWISSIPIGQVSFKDFQTRYRKNLWNKLLMPQLRSNRNPTEQNMLTRIELQDLIRGSRLHRQSQFELDYFDDDESIPESDDPDYIPEQLDEDSLEIELDDNVNPVNISTISNTSTTSQGDYCLHRILDKLQSLRPNKHKWEEQNVNSFLRMYLSSRQSISKLFLYEMDILNEEVHDTYGKFLFNKKDKKRLRVDKICNQLQRIPNLFVIEDENTEGVHYNVPTLMELTETLLLSNLFPKEYLAAPYCELHHAEEVKKWEMLSPIPIVVSDAQLGIHHIAFNFPEYNNVRNKVEMRTFDYTHILNNLRFHICNKGFDKVSTNAFLQVSNIDNEVLPRAIVEDKLDRQNASLSQRFFSEDVENILRTNGSIEEARFVKVTRGWFNACDQRGMCVEDRLSKLRDMYHYMLSLYCLSHYPPESTHIKGIPIRTYEALMHTISTRFLLYGLSTNHKYNTRAISTLAVESFFSDLNRFEFSGLGAPKAVDIPKLISHVVLLNTTKHNPKRGFEFTTSTRDNYPCHLMEEEQVTDGISIVNHPFDMNNKGLRKKRKKLWTLSKPKQITRGGRGIRELFRIDEGRLTAEQRFGKDIDMKEIYI